MDKTVIPKGDYCYTITGPVYTNKDGIPTLPTKRCPYWEHLPFGSAYCSYLDERDDLLLVDQVKICGVNMREEDVLISTD
jgi:hypothetical protein